MGIEKRFDSRQIPRAIKAIVVFLERTKDTDINKPLQKGKKCSLQTWTHSISFIGLQKEEKKIRCTNVSAANENMKVIRETTGPNNVAVYLALFLSLQGTYRTRL